MLLNWITRVRMERQIRWNDKELKIIRKRLEELQNIPNKAERADNLMKKLLVQEKWLKEIKQNHKRLFPNSMIDGVEG